PPLAQLRGALRPRLGRPRRPLRQRRRGRLLQLDSRRLARPPQALLDLRSDLPWPSYEELFGPDSEGPEDLFGNDDEGVCFNSTAADSPALRKRYWTSDRTSPGPATRSSSAPTRKAPKTSSATTTRASASTRQPPTRPPSASATGPQIGPPLAQLRGALRPRLGRPRRPLRQRRRGRLLQLDSRRLARPPQALLDL